MVEWWFKVWEFCREEPYWAATFFFCGYILGVLYF